MNEVVREMQRAKQNSYAAWQALSRANVTGKLLTDAYQVYEDIRGAQDQYEAQLKEENEKLPTVPR